MLDLESMIKHCKEVAKEQSELYECYMQHGEQGDYVNECLKCAEEHRQLAEWLKELKQLRGQPCDDAISRQAVLDCLTASGLKKFDFILDARDKITNLPSVTPQPKIGRWVENDRGISICSCCGKDKYEDIDGSIYDDVWFPNYCPNCGAKMQGVKE